jgi:hypothetical protein
MDEKEKEGLKGKEGEGQELPGAEPKTAEGTDNQPAPVPYDRFKEVNQRAKLAEERLAKLEQVERERLEQEETDRQKKLKEQQQFQSLAEEWEQKFTTLEPEHKTLKDKYDQAMEVLGGYAKSQMERVPEVFQSVVGTMPVLERLQWLTENAEKLDSVSSPGPKGIPASPKGRTPGDHSEEERRRKAARTF